VTQDDRHLAHYLRVFHHDYSGSQLRDCYRYMLDDLRARVAKDRELVIQTAAIIASGMNSPHTFARQAVAAARALIDIVDESVEPLPLQCDKEDCFWCEKGERT